MGYAHKLLCNKNKGDNHGTKVALFFLGTDRKRARGINDLWLVLSGVITRGLLENHLYIYLYLYLSILMFSHIFSRLPCLITRGCFGLSLHPPVTSNLAGLFLSRKAFLHYPHFLGVWRLCLESIWVGKRPRLILFMISFNLKKYLLEIISPRVGDIVSLHSPTPLSQSNPAISTRIKSRDSSIIFP